MSISIIQRRAINQVMPALTTEAFQSLKESIKEHGLVYPIIIDRDRNILDGHHRHQAYQELIAEGYDVELKTEMRDEFDAAQQKRDFAREINTSRRSLTAPERRRIAQAQLKETPERADQWIADITGIHNKSIARERRSLESAGEIPIYSELIRRDGRTAKRSHPTSKDIYPELGMYALPDANRLKKRLDEMPDQDERDRALRALALGDLGELGIIFGDEFSLPPLPQSTTTNGNAGYLWHRALRDVYGHVATIGRSDGFLGLVRRWEPEAQEHYLKELDRLMEVFSSWREILEQEVEEKRG